MRFYFNICITLTAILLPLTAFAQKKTENIVLITIDGARTQEVFGGLDLDVLKAKTKKGAVEDTALYKKYWAPTGQERREKIMPYFWGTLMKTRGSIAGNRELGSTAEVTNDMRFSYPGYNEILTGQANDAVITSNSKLRNPNVTFLEFLKKKLKVDTKKVASFSSWEVIDWAGEHEVGAITSICGYETFESKDPETKFYNKLQFEVPSPWGDAERWDFFTHKLALGYMKEFKPRVMYISFGDTDEYAHEGNYSMLLDTYVRTDKWLRELIEFLDTDSQYKGKTSIVITIDHGRGSTTKDWTDHGKEIMDAKYIWAAFISPDSSLRGEWKNTENIYQNQIAATLCRFLNIDYSENNPNAGKSISRLFEK